MNCIILLLLLGYCGGFGCGNNGRSYVDNGDGGGLGLPLGNGNDIRRGNPGSGNDCGCPDNGVATADNGSGCDGAEGISAFSGGGPSHWQDYPTIPGRENNCGCDD